MNIQATNAANSCQPIKEVTFSKKHAPKDVSLNETKEACDSFVSQPSVMEQKYNLACQIAGYYKNQYEELLNGKTVEA